MTEPGATPTWCAYVLARIERGEGDLSLCLLRDDGSVSWCSARKGARSTKRFAGGLSPFTRYRVRFDRTGKRLEEAVVDQSFAGILRDLRRTAAAGALCAIARDLGGEVPSDDGLFVLFDQTLSAIEHADRTQTAGLLIRFFFGAFDHAGHGVVHHRCAQCGRDAPATRSVTYALDAGGVRCGACGGGPFVLRPSERTALSAMLAGDDSVFALSMLRLCAYLGGAHARRGSECITQAVSYFRESPKSP